MLNIKLFYLPTLILIQIVFAQNANKLQVPEIISQYSDTRKLFKGEYEFGFAVSDGTGRKETGGYDSKGNYVVTGHYTYLDDTGSQHWVAYTADKDGYHLIKLPPLISQEPIAFAPPHVVAALLG